MSLDKANSPVAPQDQSAADPPETDLPETDLPEADLPEADPSGDLTGGPKSERMEQGCAMGCVAFIFAVPAVWFYWMARSFVDGDTWYDFIVRSIMDELILALGLFASVMVFAGFFPYPWLTRIVDWVTEHMAKTVLFLFWGMLGSLLLFIVVYAVLDAVGIKF